MVALVLQGSYMKPHYLHNSGRSAYGLYFRSLLSLDFRE